MKILIALAAFAAFVITLMVWFAYGKHYTERWRTLRIQLWIALAYGPWALFIGVALDTSDGGFLQLPWFAPLMLPGVLHLATFWAYMIIQLLLSTARRNDTF